MYGKRNQVVGKVPGDVVAALEDWGARSEFTTFWWENGRMDLALLPSWSAMKYFVIFLPPLKASMIFMGKHSVYA